MGSRVAQGDVAPPARHIHAQVLPEVDELQGRADLVGHRDEARIPYALEVQQQSANGIGGSAAVVQQLGAAGVHGVEHVLFEGIQKIVEQRFRQHVTGMGLPQGPEDVGPGGIRVRCRALQGS